VLVDRVVFSHPPKTLTARRKGAKGEGIKLLRAPAVTPMTDDPKGPYAWVYAASGPDLEEGTYVIGIESQALANKWRVGKKPARRTFQVSFGVHTLFGDYDFQVFDLPSIEDAILTHFAERYQHLATAKDEPPSDKPAKPSYSRQATALARFRSTAELLEAKRKMAVGFVNADSSKKARQIIDASLKAVRDSKTEGLSDAADTASRICAQMYHGEKLYKSWKEMVGRLGTNLRNYKALGLVQEAMDDKGLARLFHGTAWLDTAIKEIQKSEQGEKSLLGRYLLLRKEKGNPDVVKRLMNNAMSPKLPAFEAAWKTELKQIKVSANWVFATAATFRQIYETALAVESLSAKEDAEASRLCEALAKYQDAFAWRAKNQDDVDFAPCTEVVPRLEVLRKVADAASLETDKKRLELVKQAAQLTLKAVSLVPACASFASLTSLVGDSLEALGSVVDVVSDTIDRFMFRHKSAASRFAHLARLHMLQVRAIASAEKDKADKHDDPHTQFRLRLIVIIGLLRLIERCGSPHGKFQERAQDLDIDGYLKHFVFVKQPFPVALSSGTPLDEIWTYGCGKQHKGWIDVESQVRSIGDSLADLTRGTRTVYVPVMFQKYFPIHGMGSPSGAELARVFSLNFSEVIDKDLVYSRIYVRRKVDEPWIPVQDAKFDIEPGTAVRVAAIFKNKDRRDLSFVPMSLQINRVDPVVTVEGPEYKTCLTHTWESQDAGDGHEDKGLLPYIPDEKKYIGDADAYACVVFPFYFFQRRLIYGIKPCGHVGLSRDITLDTVFDLKAGDDGRYIGTGKAGGAAEEAARAKPAVVYPVPGSFSVMRPGPEPPRLAVRVHMHTSNRTHVDMILNKEFLAHTAETQNTENLFHFYRQKFQVGCVFWRGREGIWKYSGAEKGRFVTKLGPAHFAWGEPFELLVVFGAAFTAQQRWAGDPIKAPGFVSVQEISTSGNVEAEGPAYPIEIVSLRRDQVWGAEVGAMSIDRALRASGVLAKEERFSPAGFVLMEPSTLWAVRACFKYQVENSDGEMVAQTGLRPFGAKFVDNTGGYIYRFTVTGPGNVGLNLPNFLEMTVPGVPHDFLKGYAVGAVDSRDEKKWAWVTDSDLRKQLEVRKPR